MANFNKIFLMGNLTRDPQLSYLPSNTPVVEFGLAVNRRFRRADGEQGEETLFVDCRTFARTAEVINQYFHKGEPIFIEGRLQLDQWEDKEGNKRSKHRVFVEKFEFISKRGSTPGPAGGEEEGGYSANAPRSRPAQSPVGGPPASPPPGADPAEEDIPF